MSAELDYLNEQLQKVLNPVNNQSLRDAENLLKKWETENFVTYLMALAVYLNDKNRNLNLRCISGVILKNCFYNENESYRDELTKRWINLPSEVKVKIRELVYSTLLDSVQIRRLGSQILAKVAYIDLKTNDWPNLTDILNHNTFNNNDSNLQQATIETIGYICEEIDPESIPNISLKLVSCVLYGMRNEESNLDIKESSCEALINGIDYCHIIFEDVNQRNYLMNNIINCVKHNEMRISTKGLMLLIQIESLYYDKLEPYIAEIFQVTMDIIKFRDEDIGKLAIEFWTTLAEDEKDDHTDQNKKFTKKALSGLVQVILEAMTKQNNPDYDLDDYTLPIAASVCLNMIAEAVLYEIVPLLMPFIEKNLLSQEWNLTDAALLALGSVLESPTENISDIIKVAIPILLDILRNSKVASVKDSAAWTIGRLCKLHPMAIIEKADLIVECMLHSMRNEPARVATNACVTISNLAKIEHERNPIDKNTEKILECLLFVSNRDDLYEFNLKFTAYQAISNVITYANVDDRIYLQLLSIFCDKLEDTVKQNATNQNLVEYQELLCSVLQVLLNKLFDAAESYADKIMIILINLLKSQSGPKVASEAFLTIQTLANIMGLNFAKYMTNLNELIKAGLRNTEDFSCCFVVIGLIGDIIRAIEKQILPYCDDIVLILIQNLNQTGPNSDKLKPPLLSCFSDIAFEIGSSFNKYQSYVLPILKNTVESLLNTQIDDDMVLLDYINECSLGVIEAYSGIINGDPENIQSFTEHILPLVNLIMLLSREELISPDLEKAAIGLLGDFAKILPDQTKNATKNQTILEFIQEAMNSDKEETVNTASWAFSLLYE